jgi:mono/diheme cytochrome c family protein
MLNNYLYINKIMPQLKRHLAILFACICISGCYYDVSEELYPAAESCDTSQVTYTADIQVMLQQNCLSCHAVSANQGGVILEGYAQVKTYADNGRLLGSISHASGFSAMPQGGAQLPACTINKVRAWINHGAPEN